MKALFTLACALLLSLAGAAQTGEITGKVHTENPHDAIPYVTVAAKVDTLLVAGVVTDINGMFVIKPLGPGTYTLEVTSVGFNKVRLDSVRVEAGKATPVDIVMTTSSQLAEVVVVWERPLLEPGSPATQSTITFEEIKAAPVREVNAIAAQRAGVYTHGSEGDDMNYRGSRGDATTYYVDGVRVRDNLGTSENKKKYSTPIVGAPAQYGDPSGGVVKGVTAVVPNEQYEGLVENSYDEVAQHPLSTFSIDVDAASYSNMRRFINTGSLPPPDAVRIEEMINYFDYDYPQPEGDIPFSITTEASVCPWNTAHYLVHIGLQAREVKTENLPPNNLVFLLDVSGSMDDPKKLPLVKKSFALLVEQLRHEDKVAIVVYAGSAGLVLPSTRGDKKEKILAAIDNLRAGGSTAGGAGIELAYAVAKDNFIESGNNRVILATDGDFNVGISDDDELVSFIEGKRNEGIFLSVLGFGVGNYKDAKMEKLADKGNGNMSYVDNLLEAHKVFVSEMGATLLTLAKDVKLQVEFNPLHVKAYRLVGYENRMLEDEDFNDDRKDAGELGAGASVTALYEIIPAGNREHIPDIDSLKYQAMSATGPAAEMLTVKIRYKEPGALSSQRFEKILPADLTPPDNTSDNFRFSASVAEFGMILGGSDFRGTSGYNSVLSLAKSSKGPDENGYRAEFIRLVETARLLHGTADR